MNETEDSGRRLLSAVERLLVGDEELAREVERALGRAGLERCRSEAEFARAADAVIRGYARRTMVSGGLTALPALLPGVGTVATLTGGVLADMAFTLKCETEMALALSHLHGFDVRQERERRAALLLASIATYDAKTEGNFLADVAEAQGTAIWNYAPRQASKLLLLVLSKLALLAAGKGLARAVPLVGIAVGASLNRVLTERVGERIRRELQARRSRGEADAEPGGEPVVDARVVR